MVYRRNVRTKRRTYRTRRSYPRRRTYRRTYRSSRSNRNTSVVLSKSLQAGFPQMYITRLKYTETIDLNAAAGTVAYHAYRANGIYDPNYTGVGHQPLGHDSLAGLYKTYIVIGSKMTARFLSQDDGMSPILVGIMQRSDGTLSGLTNANTIMEQGNNRYRIINSRGSYQGGFPPTTITSKWSLRKFLGVKDWRDNTYGMGAAFGADPPRVSFLTPYAADLTGSTDLDNIIVTVTVEYVVACFEPLLQDQS